jgi:hypothetical protein
MSSIKKTSRIAGLLYLFIAVTGFFTTMYVPETLLVRGDAGATAARILASEGLFRSGIAIGMVSSVAFLFLALALYRLFEEVSRRLAALMVILVIVQIPLAVLDAVNQLAALELVRGAGVLPAFTEPQRYALAMLLLRQNGLGTFPSEIFWGLWLVPLGVLVFRSGFLPRVLGVWLIIACLAYLALGFTGMLVPQHLGVVNRIALPLLLGEVAFALWLLVVGVRPKRAAGSGPVPADA